jgi:hypothetical protein
VLLVAFAVAAEAVDGAEPAWAEVAAGGWEGVEHPVVNAIMATTTKGLTVLITEHAFMVVCRAAVALSGIRFSFYVFGSRRFTLSLIIRKTNRHGHSNSPPAGQCTNVVSSPGAQRLAIQPRAQLDNSVINWNTRRWSQKSS